MNWLARDTPRKLRACAPAIRSIRKSGYGPGKAGGEWGSVLAKRFNGRPVSLSFFPTLEVIMGEPAIAAEQSKVPSTPDGQIPLGLWPDQDPNLHRVGIYKFEIDATNFDQALRDAVLPKRGAPFLTVEVSTSALKIIAQTKDASFVISTSTPLLPHAEIGSAPIAFEVDRDVIMNTIRHFTGQLAFTFDRDSWSLAWNRHGLAVAGVVTKADGTAERRASQAMLKAKRKAVGHRIAAGADNAYDTKGHVEGPC